MIAYSYSANTCEAETGKWLCVQDLPRLPSETFSKKTKTKQTEKNREEKDLILNETLLAKINLCIYDII